MIPVRLRRLSHFISYHSFSLLHSHVDKKGNEKKKVKKTTRYFSSLNIYERRFVYVCTYVYVCMYKHILTYPYNLFRMIVSFVSFFFLLFFVTYLHLIATTLLLLFLVFLFFLSLGE